MSDTTRIHKPLYRVFHLNRTGGIDWADIVEALDDEDAVARIRLLADDHAVELWDRARFIAKVEPPLNALVPAAVVTRRAPDPIDEMAGVEGPGDDQMPKLVH